MCSVLGGFGNRRSSQRNASVVIKLNIFRLFFGGASQKLPKKKKVHSTCKGVATIVTATFTTSVARQIVASQISSSRVWLLFFFFLAP